jgi:hypothetical protein
MNMNMNMNIDMYIYNYNFVSSCIHNMDMGMDDHRIYYRSSSDEIIGIVFK